MRYFVTILLFLLLVLPVKLFAAELENPLGTTQITTIIGRLISTILGVTGSIALLMFIYGGFLWLVSAGDPKRVDKGKDVMKYAIFGLAIIIGAYAMVRTVLMALESGTIT